jgi:hypothetical protein
VAAAPDADVYLLERSPATDRVFMHLQAPIVDPMEMAMYADWCDAYMLMLPVDLTRATVLYLKTSLDRCMARLAGREREEELAQPEAEGDGSAKGGVSLEYQRRLRRAHEAFFLGLHADEFPALVGASPFPRESIVELEGPLADGNFRDAGPERDGILAAILAKMGFR